MCVIPSLTLPTQSDRFIMQTDKVGLGAVLSLWRVEGDLPVAIYSWKLLPRETQYSATELKGLAVVCAVEHFAP